MIDKEAAREIARNEILSTALPEDLDIALLDDATIERPFGWVFFYTSRRYLETKDVRHAVGGNAPIIVDRRDGTVHHTGTGRPVGFYIEQYEAKRIAGD